MKQNNLEKPADMQADTLLQLYLKLFLILFQIYAISVKIQGHHCLQKELCFLIQEVLVLQPLRIFPELIPVLKFLLAFLLFLFLLFQFFYSFYGCLSQYDYMGNSRIETLNV